MEMRAVFAKTLEKEMESNSEIVVLDADLAKANGTLDIRKKFPERALDVGIAEQNMTSIAAGLSSYGFIPIISSFTPFATRRICDQVAISIAYAKSNVKIVGTDPGISAELNGGTHMSTEDIGVMRSIPGLVIFEPSSAIELEKALPQIIKYDGAVYMRMHRKQLPEIYDEDYEFNLFKADVMKEGSDVTIVSSGILVYEAQKAGEMLEELGISAEIINVHTIKPIDRETIVNSAKKTGAVLTVENHNIIGGLNSAVCEVLSKELPTPVTAIGFEDCFGEVGMFDELKAKFKFTAHDIVEKAKQVIELKKKRG